jgi:hypothetical protein
MRRPQRGRGGGDPAVLVASARSLVNLSRKSGTWRVGDLEHGAQHFLLKASSCVLSVFVGVHRRPTELIGKDHQEPYGRR